MLSSTRNHPSRFLQFNLFPSVYRPGISDCAVRTPDDQHQHPNSDVKDLDEELLRSGHETSNEHITRDGIERRVISERADKRIQQAYDEEEKGYGQSEEDLRFIAAELARPEEEPRHAAHEEEASRKDHDSGLDGRKRRSFIWNVVVKEDHIANDPQDHRYQEWKIENAECPRG